MKKKSQAATKPAMPGSAVPPAPPLASTADPVSPVTSFPIDTEPIRRGPGRPPKLCLVCNLPASECAGHPVAKFEIGEQTVKGLYQMLGHLIALSFSMSTGVPAEQLGPL